jgi:hypothetical protein
MRKLTNALLWIGLAALIIVFGTTPGCGGGGSSDRVVPVTQTEITTSGGGETTVAFSATVMPFDGANVRLLMFEDGQDVFPASPVVHLDATKTLGDTISFPVASGTHELAFRIESDSPVLVTDGSISISGVTYTIAPVSAPQCQAAGTCS